ncbi:hypothetical protein HPB50_004425 [Hyalomma asiaticum]|uniref:Uncharacterized protein n=1 Tax=Hyalomma asiaticum TaxID=266040 RepID=A0ACB7TCH3_HYAAI|nr:hypothetical protein HPB50_004425 [Hyalomma asiaticum]
MYDLRPVDGEEEVLSALTGASGGPVGLALREPAVRGTMAHITLADKSQGAVTGRSTCAAAGVHQAGLRRPSRQQYTWAAHVAWRRWPDDRSQSGPRRGPPLCLARVHSRYGPPAIGRVKPALRRRT